MAKIFAAQAELNNHPSRNNFDLSHKIHMTGKMGLLYPVLCKPVVPGDSFRIDSGCAFNFMPMPYPTQTRMRFIQHFFYVRNKNLWKNWQNWLQGLEEHVPPYIDQPASYYRTGSLADFLGIPTSIKSRAEFLDLPSTGMGMSLVTPGQGAPVFFMSNLHSQHEDGGARPFMYYHGNGDTDQLIPESEYVRFKFLYVNSQSVCSGNKPEPDGNGWYTNGNERNITRFFEIPQIRDIRLSEDETLTFHMNNPLVPANGSSLLVSFWEQKSGEDIVDSLFRRCFRITHSTGSILSITLNSDYTSKVVSMLSASRPGSKWYVAVTASHTEWPVEYSNCYVNSEYGQWPVHSNSAKDISEVGGANPYYSSSNTDEDTVRVSALPFRAYESIYNAFYRNQHGNQPFKVNGVTKYNQYITTDEDGSDTTTYRLFQRNWELDAYTSCLPSPQQGPAPVVGITALGKVTIVDPETGVTTTAQATDTPNGMQFTDVSIGEASHQQYLVNLASSGITINDFRQVNSLQRFLETNIRKGFRYVDFIEGHFGQRIKDAVMDMPEFIGGFSQTVDVNMISNTTAQEIDKVQQLGSYGGQASAFGGTQHTINHYCDDYGWIIGILCLVPEPSYSQILPKHFNIKQPLDFYFPEFAQIGLQPITYEEFCPVESKVDSIGDTTKKLTDVFGYQRPNHDMVWYPDTLHGEFRKTFSDFIVNRMFVGRPELGNDFLTIKPEETNSIFNYTAPDEDVFVGQLAFSIKAKRPVPRIVVPSLGR